MAGGDAPGGDGPGGDLDPGAVRLAELRVWMAEQYENELLIGSLDTTGVTEAKTGLGSKRWKANRTHAAPVAVARELKVARTLVRFPGFAEALAGGFISTDHVLVLALAGVCNERTLGALVEQEHAIVSFAKIHRFEVFTAYLRRLAAMVDSDGTEPDCGDRDIAAMGRDLEGHLHLSLELSRHNAIEIEGIVNSEVDRQYRAAVRESETAAIAVPAMGVLRARAPSSWFVVVLIRTQTTQTRLSQWSWRCPSGTRRRCASRQDTRRPAVVGPERHRPPRPRTPQSTSRSLNPVGTRKSWELSSRPRRR